MMHPSPDKCTYFHSYEKYENFVAVGVCSSYSQSHLDERISFDLRTRGDGSALGSSYQFCGQLFSTQIPCGNHNISPHIQTKLFSATKFCAVCVGVESLLREDWSSLSSRAPLRGAGGQSFLASVTLTFSATSSPIGALLRLKRPRHQLSVPSLKIQPLG